MSVTTSKAASDPFAPLSWFTSKVLLALRKLELGRSIGGEDSEAISYVAKEFGLLSQASEIDIQKTSAVVPPDLRESFCTLVAIRERATPHQPTTEFKRGGEDLEVIKACLDSGQIQGIPRATLGRARRICLELLEHLNDQRPNSTMP